MFARSDAFAGVPFMFGNPLGQGDLWRLLLLGVVQLGLPYVVYAMAVKHVTALEAILKAVSLGTIAVTAGVALARAFTASP